jgi:hypothetical protein
MTAYSWSFSLVFFMSQLALADFDYSCQSVEGRIMGFATTSLFGQKNQPIFTYDDKEGLDFGLVGSQILVSLGAEWYVHGPITGHQLYTSFVATFPVVYGSLNPITASLKLKDSLGVVQDSIDFSCIYR